MSLLSMLDGLEQTALASSLTLPVKNVPYLIPFPPLNALLRAGKVGKMLQLRHTVTFKFTVQSWVVPNGLNGNTSKSDGVAQARCPQPTRKLVLRTYFVYGVVLEMSSLFGRGIPSRCGTSRHGNHTRPCRRSGQLRLSCPSKPPSAWVRSPPKTPMKHSSVNKTITQNSGCPSNHVVVTLVYGAVLWHRVCYGLRSRRKNLPSGGNVKDMARRVSVTA